MGGERAAAATSLASNLLEVLFRVLLRFPLPAMDGEGPKTSIGEAVKRPTEKRDFEAVDEARDGVRDTGLERDPEAVEGMLRD